MTTTPTLDELLAEARRIADRYWTSPDRSWSAVPARLRQLVHQLGPEHQLELLDELARRAHAHDVVAREALELAHQRRRATDTPGHAAHILVLWLIHTTMPDRNLEADVERELLESRRPAEALEEQQLEAHPTCRRCLQAPADHGHAPNPEHPDQLLEVCQSCNRAIIDELTTGAA